MILFKKILIEVLKDSIFMKMYDIFIFIVLIGNIFTSYFNINKKLRWDNNKARNKYINDKFISVINAFTYNIYILEHNYHGINKDFLHYQDLQLSKIM